MESRPAATADRRRGSPVERVAHRGARLERVENTLPAFIVALERGADALELDVHATVDGVPVVHHDDAAGGMPIARTRWDDLRKLDLGSGSAIPTLAEVLEEVGSRATTYVELKGAGIEEHVLAAVRGRAARDSMVALHSFDHQAIARVARLAPDIPRGVLLDKGTREPVRRLLEAAQATHARDLWPHWSLIDERMIEVARRIGARVIAWTVNSVETARHLAELGVDGICTDDVRLLANL